MGVPEAGGLTYRQLTNEQKITDKEARFIISKDLGHDRIEIVRVYCGL